MPATAEAQVLITAVDRLTAPAKRMQAALDRIGAPGRRVAQALGEVGRVTGIDALAGKFRALGSRVVDVTGRVGTLAASVTGLAGISLGAGLFGAGAGMMKTNMEFEKFQTVLTTLLGSSAKAKEAMGWIQSFAQTTPYELSEVTGAFIKLKAYGINAADGTLRAVGDAAAAMGKPIDQMVEAFADAQSGEFSRLKEALGGTFENKNDKITYKFVDKDGIARTFSAANKDAKALQEMVKKIFEAKGFTGGMDNLSKTLEGMVSNVKDAGSGFYKMIGDAGAFEFVKGKVQRLLDTIQKLKDDGTLQRWAKEISDTFIRVATRIEEAFFSIDWGAAWGGVERFISELRRAVEYVGGWGNALLILGAVLNVGLIASVVQLGVQIGALVPLFAKAITAISAIMLGNPIGLVIAGIAAGAALIIYKWDAVAAYFTRAFAAIKAAFDQGFIAGIVEVISRLNFVTLLSDAVVALVDYLFGINLYEAGLEMWVRFQDGMADAWDGIMQYLDEALAKLVDMLPDFAKESMGLTGTAELQTMPSRQDRRKDSRAQAQAYADELARKVGASNPALAEDIRRRAGLIRTETAFLDTPDAPAAATPSGPRPGPTKAAAAALAANPTGAVPAIPSYSSPFAPVKDLPETGAPTPAAPAAGPRVTAPVTISFGGIVDQSEIERRVMPVLNRAIEEAMRRAVDRTPALTD